MRRVPDGLREISRCERALWHTCGPLLAADDVALIETTVSGSDQVLYHIWENWGQWCGFYSGVREQLFDARPWLRSGSAAERLFHAWLEGGDVDRVREQIAAERAATDPRLLLGSK